MGEPRLHRPPKQGRTAAAGISGGAHGSGCDRDGAHADLLDLYRSMVKIRQFERRAHELFLAGELPGFLHLYLGEEAIAAGVTAALEPGDLVASSHRGHGHLIAKGGDVKRMMAEIFGRATGYGKGKGGSMHVADLDLGMLGANGIVGAGIPIATGAALACQYLGEGKVTVVFFGDAASNRGTFHEAVNLGAVWDLPIVYVCENNHYGVSTCQRDHMKIRDIADRAVAYGIAGRVGRRQRRRGGLRGGRGGGRPGPRRRRSHPARMQDVAARGPFRRRPLRLPRPGRA